ncbi:hypothetical protein TorRG33x02_156190 [Trema orientale]|uniref:Uncharacterized protein n=1 Tax=Trema orientale TaxID=63057 RepID=A0A2P5ESN3_TREOI|nr:hypothetical protein TorRG33x02_156190 [Trema orientale]
MKIKEEISSEGFRHHHLREVEIYNFKGNFDGKQVELIRDLMNHSVAIDKIQIDRRVHIYTGNGELSTIMFGERTPRKQVYELLRQRLPPTTNLKVL